MKFERLWITCDPENAASRRSLELAGAKFVEVVDVPEDCVIYRRGMLGNAATGSILAAE